MQAIFKSMVSVAIIYCSACSSSMNETSNNDNDMATKVVENYADIAHAVYSDALITAKQLDEALEAFASNPSAASHLEAKQAWKNSRPSYQQSEVFRFANAVVDDWEPKMNTWPLDEGMIDYVADDYDSEMGNIAANANIVANKALTFGDDSIDASKITPELLVSLNLLADSEANVTTGYHAIEFLLWGQDLHGNKPGAGERPWTDYAQGKKCTHGNCDRRRDFLLSAGQQMVEDLEYMVGQWEKGKDNYRAELLDQTSQEGVRKILFGMGSLSLGELAGDRMKASLQANSTEDEHDCFSDNTHISHYYTAKGIQNVFLGRYERISGKVVEGASLSDLLEAKDPAMNKTLSDRLETTEKVIALMVDTAENGNMKFDQMIETGNTKGNKIIKDSIDALVAQTAAIEKAAGVLGVVNFEAEIADHSF